MGIGINPDYKKDGKNYLWENLTIPYKIDGTFVCDSKHRLLDMINEWNDSRMVIKYKPYDGEDDYVLFVEAAEGGGSSHIGCVKRGKQIIKFDLDRQGNDTILHEMGHAAGLHHEHQRCDRNSYIKMIHTFFNRDYDENSFNGSDDYWAELVSLYNEQYDPDIDVEEMKQMMKRYGIIPTNDGNRTIYKKLKKYKIYTCYDYRSIMHYKTSKVEQIRSTKYDTIRSYPEIFGGYNYVGHSPFSSSRNDQTARNGLSFNDIYTIWRIYIEDCPVPPRHCTYTRPQIYDLTSLSGSALR